MPQQADLCGGTSRVRAAAGRTLPRATSRTPPRRAGRRGARFREPRFLSKHMRPHSTVGLRAVLKLERPRRHGHLTVGLRAVLKLQSLRAVLKLERPPSMLLWGRDRIWFCPFFWPEIRARKTVPWFPLCTANIQNLFVHVFDRLQHSSAEMLAALRFSSMERTRPNRSRRWIPHGRRHPQHWHRLR